MSICESAPERNRVRLKFPLEGYGMVTVQELPSRLQGEPWKVRLSWHETVQGKTVEIYMMIPEDVYDAITTPRSP